MLSVAVCDDAVVECCNMAREMKDINICYDDIYYFEITRGKWRDYMKQ